MIARMSERGGGKQAGVGAVAVLACAVFASPAAWAQSSAPDSPRTVPEQIAPPAESGPAGNAAPAPVMSAARRRSRDQGPGEDAHARQLAGGAPTRHAGG